MTNPDTWASYPEAKAVTVGDGLGFVLGEGVGCLDFDNVIAGGVLHPSVEKLLESLPETWVEVSPSGTGLHVWGLIPEAAGRVLYVGGVRVERYSRARYMTVTGQRFRGAPLKLADLSETLSW